MRVRAHRMEAINEFVIVVVVYLEFEVECTNR